MMAARVQIPASPLETLENKHSQGFFFAKIYVIKIVINFVKLSSTNSTTNSINQIEFTAEIASSPSG